MDAKTLKALKGSIEKWEKIVKGRGIDEGTDNCPLCKLFFDAGDLNHRCCVGCPVRDRVDTAGCRNTPYYDDWLRADGMLTTTTLTQEQRLAAKRELAFLKSLLPKKKEK